MLLALMNPEESRLRLLSSKSGVAAQRQDARQLRIQQAQICLRDALSALKPIAEGFACVLVQSEMYCEGLEAIGFSRLMTADHTNEHFSVDGDNAILVVGFGSDTRGVVPVVRELEHNESVPQVIVVLVIPSPEIRSWHDLEDSMLRGGSRPFIQCDPQDSADLGASLSEARHDLFLAGADDIVCLCGGEVFQPYRLKESVDRYFEMGIKAKTAIDSIIERETGRERERCIAKIKQLYKNTLRSLPGEVLENIPPQDPLLVEEVNEQSELIKIGDYNLVGVLGAGSFGRVFRAKRPNKDEVLAIKIIPKARVMTSVGQLLRLDQEIRLMRSLPQHDNIVRAYSVLHSQHLLSVIMDYAGGESLEKYSQRVLRETGEAAFAPEVVDSFWQQEVSGIAHLHGHLVCHRDIKPDNWVVSECGRTIRLTDFGMAAHILNPDELLKTVCGSMPFCAPEVLVRQLARRGGAADELHRHLQATLCSNGGYDSLAADIWSLGLNLFELLMGPFSIERVLGWSQQRPKDDHAKSIEKLLTLPELCTQALSDSPSPLSYIIHSIQNQVVVDPAQRWKIQKIAGARALLQPRRL